MSEVRGVAVWMAITISENQKMVTFAAVDLDRDKCEQKFKDIYPDKTPFIFDINLNVETREDVKTRFFAYLTFLDIVYSERVYEGVWATFEFACYRICCDAERLNKSKEAKGDNENQEG